MMLNLASVAAVLTAVLCGGTNHNLRFNPNPNFSPNLNPTGILTLILTKP